MRDFLRDDELDNKYKGVSKTEGTDDEKTLLIVSG